MRNSQIFSCEINTLYSNSKIIVAHMNVYLMAQEYECCRCVWSGHWNKKAYLARSQTYFTIACMQQITELSMNIEKWGQICSTYLV